MLQFDEYQSYFPKNSPQMSIGKLTHKVIIKKDYANAHGLSAIYLQFHQSGKKKMLNLQIKAPIKHWCPKKQRVKKSYPGYSDINLIIEKALAKLNDIQISYRLQNAPLTINQVITEITNPGIRLNFNAFAATELKKQKTYLKPSTYKQQQSTLLKIKQYQDPLFFKDITSDFLRQFTGHMKTNLQNKKPTINSTLKNFKKYIHLANKQNIQTPLHYSEVKVGSMKGDRTFLTPSELNKMYHYFFSPYIPTHHKAVLRPYLFSCFTGLRRADIYNLTANNFINGNVIVMQQKTQKPVSIYLTKSANKLINLPFVFGQLPTPEHINRELKVIARNLEINKKITFHTARHTFATNFLLAGGSVIHLKELLGHSDIKMTMIYVHKVQSYQDKSVTLLEKFITPDFPGQDQP
jgi:integrase/recombinase XerD